MKSLLIGKLLDLISRFMSGKKRVSKREIERRRKQRDEQLRRKHR